MLNGHMDTSYIGNEEYLPDRPGYKPHAVERRRLALRARHLQHERRDRGVPACGGWSSAQ